MHKTALTFVAFALVAGCASHAQKPQAPSTPQAAPISTTAPHENLNAVLWVQTALEYRASALQAYRAAEADLDAALADPTWTAAIEQKGDVSKLPPAIILDIDETVLDNSYYQARMIRDNTVYATDSWDAWVMEARAPAVPGAREFTQYAAKKGVTVFYVTNRTANIEDATRKNLAAEQFPVSTEVDTVLVRGERPEWAASSKASRREYIANSYRILLLIGDDLGDFIGDASGTPDERLTRTAPYEGWWGRRWIILPNPTYGSWERAIIGSEQDHVAARRRALQFQPK